MFVIAEDHRFSASQTYINYSTCLFINSDTTYEQLLSTINEDARHQTIARIIESIIVTGVLRNGM